MPASPRYLWPEGKRCCAVFSLDLDAESPFLWAHRGKPVVSMQELEQRRFGPRVGIWRVLELVESLGIRGSFFVPGWVANRYPELLPAIVARGHEIGYHGYYHERLNATDPDEAERFLDLAIEEFRRQTGRTDYGHRSAGWEMTPRFIAHMKLRGIVYDSSLMGYDHPYTVDGLTELPVTWTVDDALYFRYTSSPADKTHPANPRQVLESWLEEFEGVRQYGGLFMITVHDWVSGRAQRLRMLAELLGYLRRHDDVWIATCGEVAAWHAASPNAMRFAVEAQLLDTRF